MIINGVDVSKLSHATEKDYEAPPVPMRVAHIDADFLAYQMAAVDTPDNPVKLEDMADNMIGIADTMRQYCKAQFASLEFTHPRSNKGGRSDIALLKEYQVSRKFRERPRKLNKLKFYMNQFCLHHTPRDDDNNPIIRVNLWSNCEADDALAMWNYRACRRGSQNYDANGRYTGTGRTQSVLVSKDKDLLMVPGLHVDWMTGEEFDVSGYGHVYLDRSGKQPKLAGCGTAMLWAQMLRGDPVDDVQGLPLGPHVSTGRWGKVGPAFAVSVLEGCTTNSEAYCRVRDLYKEYGKLYGFTDYRDQSPVTWQEAFASEMSLLWMRRYPDDEWDCLTWLKKVRALGG